MDPLKPGRMATLAVYWWVISLPTLLLCYQRFLFTHFDALNEKPHCDQPYAGLWEDCFLQLISITLWAKNDIISYFLLFYYSTQAHTI